MAFSRIAAAAVFQVLLFACGVGLVFALQARFAAVAAVLGLTAFWIAAAAAWQGRLRPAPLTESAGRLASEGAQARLLASLLDQTPAPLVTCDARQVLQVRNRAARKLFGVDDVILDPPAALVKALRTGGASARVEVAVGAAPQRTYALSLSEVLAAEGPLQLAVLLDIEPEVRAAEAAALRELMQVLSHEIMNGLTPVASLAATAEELLAESDASSIMKAREALAVLSRRAEGLARFAESYRSLARLPPPTLAPTSITELIEEAARLFRSRWSHAQVSLVAQAPVPDAQLLLDRDQIMHALLNLLSNAAEAALAAPAPAGVELAGCREGRDVVLSVGDSGAGVALKDRERVFHPFFTTKPQGSGIGLSLSRQIARAHGGELELSPPQFHRGAVFRMRWTAYTNGN